MFYLRHVAPSGIEAGSVKDFLEMATAQYDRTVDDFGDQWSRYTDNSGYYGSQAMFSDIVCPLLHVEDFVGKTVVDVGSGSGRIVNMLCTAGAGKVFAVEPSVDAFAVLKTNSAAHAERITYLNVSGEEVPAVDADLVLSIGVIHHIPGPDATVRACYDALRPGGRCFFWLYGREGNETYLRFAVPLRRLSVRMPHWMLAGFSHLLNVALSGYIFLSRFLPLPMRDYTLNVLRPMTRDKRYLIIYDQLNPAEARYYTEQEAIDLMARAGFTDIRTFHRHSYSWSVIGTKP